MSAPAPERPPDWEAFYRDYRRPGYVDGFEITSKLGGGAYGLVFRARRMSIGKDYAIKFLRVDDVEVQRAVLAELGQVRHFAQIDHPNLVSIEDRGEVDGIPYLVMAFAGTETLKDRMPQGAPPSGEEKGELLRLFLQCCRGLAALHERGLVHFDVKPANVFLKGGVARLGDYGLSKLVTHGGGSLSAGRGTPYYMAPELLERRGDQRSDIYSLGVVLYELLCGRVPFSGETEWEVLRQHERTPPPLPAHLTAVERAVLARCLAKDPADRFPGVPDVIAALGAAVPAGARAIAAGARHGVEPPDASADLPACTAPPPAAAVAARRARRRAARETGTGSRPGLWLLGGLLVAAIFGVRGANQRPARTRYTVQVEQRGGGAPHRSGAASARQADDVERLVADVLGRARTAADRNRPLPLQPLDRARVAAPPDLDAYRQLLQPLAASAVFVPGQAKKLERYGRPMVLCAVAMLQEFDYAGQRECVAATNLLRFLAAATAVDELVVEPAGSVPSASEVCRLRVVADGWRRFAERFCCDEASYRRLLQARGKFVPGATAQQGER